MEKLNKNENLELDIEALIKVLNGDKVKNPELNTLTIGASCYGSIYPETNEYIKSYYNKNLKNKRILSVTSSGDHILHAVLAGATDITGFDIDRFSKYYSALRIAMVKTYEQDNFISNHKSFFNISKQLPLFTTFDKKLYNACVDRISRVLSDVSSHLTYDKKSFWNEYLNTISKTYVSKHLFVDVDNTNDFVNKVAYLDPFKYEILKENLKCANINYVDKNVINLDKNDLGTYDFIYLSNMIERILSRKYVYIDEEELIEESINLLKHLLNLLNDDGIICDIALHEYLNPWDYACLENIFEIFNSLDETHQYVFKYRKKRENKQ